MSYKMSFPAEDFIPTRYSLLSRLKNWDDQDSWKDFFDTYWRLIYAIALKSGLTDTEAQEVVQETIISVAKNIQKFRHDPSLGSFKGWLRNLTRWRILDQIRKRTDLQLGAGNLAGKTDPPPDLASIPSTSEEESVWENEWRVNLMAVALENIRKQVKEEYYQMFDLYVLKQWPVAKVAHTLGTNAARVYLAKFRVSALIKKEIHRLENQGNHLS